MQIVCEVLLAATCKNSIKVTLRAIQLTVSVRSDQFNNTTSSKEASRPLSAAPLFMHLIYILSLH